MKRLTHLLVALITLTNFLSAGIDTDTIIKETVPHSKVAFELYAKWANKSYLEGGENELTFQLPFKVVNSAIPRLELFASPRNTPDFGGIFEDESEAYINSLIAERVDLLNEQNAKSKGSGSKTNYLFIEVEINDEDSLLITEGDLIHYIVHSAYVPLSQQVSHTTSSGGQSGQLSLFGAGSTGTTGPPSNGPPSNGPPSSRIKQGNEESRLPRLNNQIKKKKVLGSELFISHASEDEGFANGLVNYIEGFRYHTWIYTRDGTAGEIDDYIQKGIDDSDVFLIVLSRHSVYKDWVRRELALALNKEQSTECKFICPIALDDSWKYVTGLENSDIKAMKKYNVLDFSDWFDPQAFASKVLNLERQFRSVYRLYREPRVIDWMTSKQQEISYRIRQKQINRLTRA